MWLSVAVGQRCQDLDIVGWPRVALALGGYLPAMTVLTSPRHAARPRVRSAWSAALLLMLTAVMVPVGVTLLLGFGVAVVGLLLPL